VTSWLRDQPPAGPVAFTRTYTEINMKNEGFPAHTGRAICALGVFVLIAGTSASLAQAPATPMGNKGAMDMKHSTMPGMTASADMHGSMTGMTKNMESMKMSGDTDRDFATMMKVHHQGAIDMAQMELTNGKDPKMRAMAKGIIKAQEKEIKKFDEWIAKAR